MRKILLPGAGAMVAAMVLAGSAGATTGAPRAAPSEAPPVRDASAVVSSVGRAYAVALFSKIPLPSGAIALAAPDAPLHPVSGLSGFRQVVDVARYYLVPSSFGVSAWSESRFAHSTWQGAASSSDGGYHFSDSFTAMSYCPDRHATECEVTYSAEALTRNRQELRVDVAVLWMPVHIVHLPSRGVVTLTGFSELSFLNRSQGGVRVTLNDSQVATLSADIAQLRTYPTGGLCMEEVILYRITVRAVQGGAVIWTGVGDECPGVLAVSSSGTLVALSARSCPLDSLLASLLPLGQAQGTRSGLKACRPSF